MIMRSTQKVTKDHLRRNAYLYVRQSTMKQVLEHHPVSFDCVGTLGLTSTPGQGLGALVKNSNIPVVKVDSVTLLARDLPDDIEGL